MVFASLRTIRARVAYLFALGLQIKLLSFDLSCVSTKSVQCSCWTVAAVRSSYNKHYTINLFPSSRKNQHQLPTKWAWHSFHLEEERGLLEMWQPVSWHCHKWNQVTHLRNSWSMESEFRPLVRANGGSTWISRMQQIKNPTLIVQDWEQHS